MRNNHLVIGILAHVDAGKTTLAEGILYTCGSIRTLGRVDHKDAFLDNFALERARGITIFSKQAQVEWENLKMTLLDTPGHVDFSAEMERTLQVLDYAILVINGSDGVQGHVETLWRLLKKYEIPVFIFINKMDMEGTDKERLLGELAERLDTACVEFGEAQEGKECFHEALAMCDEGLMEEYLETGFLCTESIAFAIGERRVFPCYFGSALKLTGVEELLQGISVYALRPEYPEEPGARVFKITRDGAGNRLTHLKVTGGVLRAKMFLGNENSAGATEEVWQEKADQLRIYNGSGFQTVEKAEAGEICAVTGLTKTFAGQGLGYEEENELPVLEPVLTYQLVLPEGSDAITVLGQLRRLEEEEPLLHIVWKEALSEIHVQVMGEVQVEILKSLIAERFGLEVEFGNGSIVYKETIAQPVIGIGHFEPLRHYAEVHLLMEPAERGSGLQFASLCSEDMLDRNWQRLVLTHLEEKTHVGVLTGSEITDMRISLIAGRAHQKHTEGGDFRQATYRALRQGLRKSKSVLLEPYFAFTLELPTQLLGRAMSDIRRMQGSFDAPVTKGGRSTLTGSAPVATMRDYQREFSAYTKGYGRMNCALAGYKPCHNGEEIVEKLAYDPEADLENPTGSVFCSHGAGFVVEWDRVDEYAHVQNGWKWDELTQGADSRTGGEAEGDIMEYALSAAQIRSGVEVGERGGKAVNGHITQEEIEEIFRQTYGKRQEDKSRFSRYHKGGRREWRFDGGNETGEAGAKPGTKDGKGGTHGGKDGVNGKTPQRSVPVSNEAYLLVDGYNIIFAWQELRELAAINIDSARDRLIDIMSNYQGYLGSTVIVVFDAYKVKGNPGSVFQYHNIHVVYTKEAETADQYIEKTVHEIGQKYQVTVATSDALEQMIIWGEGAIRMSAQGLFDAVERAKEDMRRTMSELLR